ncbi:hypothetical protein DFJ58DRAFT_726471 [Suillus subalutaceus]|uniref:uncharacterized protein n=1 Tax=Suillus subalutaceus TaxID=48586 RepID=UPI001B85F2AC|nr:uncharacterized protein DFJ58DRAFT_726471 [Suillus subalutaceus]KAG1859011.1 hypothetical protein DFJ58DRAFT_726471 [Suillus subalutaceus]
MAASSNPTDESSHLYDALPNDQDFDSIISDAKFTADTRTEFYDSCLTSRRYALVGVACSTIFGCSCTIAGIVILVNHGVLGATDMSAVNFPLLLGGGRLPLALDLIVTLCTESIGLVHGISLRSALASESRLDFNTNLRLLTAARGWYNPNGTLFDGISAVLLIISYSSASLVCIDTITIVGMPLLVLGVALLLQVIIALSAMRAVKILTWSSSPFDLTAALVHHMQLTHATLRCMRCVSDLDTDGGPVKPSKIQPSAWHAHPSIRKVVISLWVIVAACAGWAALVTYISHRDSHFTSMTPNTWSFLPNGQSSSIWYSMPGVNLELWILLFVNMAVVQGPLTLGLHCSELIANVIRDERQWRCATGRKGLRTAMNPVKTINSHSPDLSCTFRCEAFPAITDWMFGLSFQIANDISEGKLVGSGVFMNTPQIWNLCIALFMFVYLITSVARYRPRGPQPAASGHLQTLANLVDEWYPVMWWGHKEDGIPYCHAGTSDHPLPLVKMDCVCAGSGAESLAPRS